MKKSIYYLMMMVVTLSMLSVLNACGDDDDKNLSNDDAIVGTWVDDWGYETTFNADGTGYMIEYSIEKFKYLINWDSMTLVFIFWDEDDQEYTDYDEPMRIVSLTKNKLVLRYVDEPDGENYVLHRKK